MSVNVLTQSRYGPMLVNQHDRYVGEAFVHCGEYGEAEVSLLRALVRPGDHVVMAGANIGALVVPVAQVVGEQGRVLAFEPQLHPYHLLCANVAMNDLFHVECFRYAVGDERGVVQVPRWDPRQPVNSGGTSIGEGNDSVPILSIDSMGLQALDVLQADVEGSELAVLAGAAQTIQRDHPLLYLEADRLEQRGALLTWLIDAGYEVWEHTPPLWNPENYSGQQSGRLPHEQAVRWPNVVSINWLCVHPDKPRDWPEDFDDALRSLWPRREITVPIPGSAA